MESQHRKIAGCRELSEQEIELMSLTKAKGAELLALQQQLYSLAMDAQARARFEQCRQEWAALKGQYGEQ